MARTLTPPDVWTAIPSGPSILMQAVSGPIFLSKSASPTYGDYISLNSGDTVELKSAVYAKGSNGLSAIVTLDHN